MIYPAFHATVILLPDGSLEVIPMILHWENIRDWQNMKKPLPTYMVLDFVNCPKDGHGYYVMEYKNQANETSYITCVTSTKELAKEYFIDVVKDAREGTRKIHDLTKQLEDIQPSVQYLPQMNQGKVRDQLIEWKISNPMRDKMDKFRERFKGQ